MPDPTDLPGVNKPLEVEKKQYEEGGDAYEEEYLDQPHKTELDPARQQELEPDSYSRQREDVPPGLVTSNSGPSTK